MPQSKHPEPPLTAGVTAVSQRTVCRIIGSGLLWLSVIAPAAADFERGLRAYQRSDFALARLEFFQSAMEGHAGAQFYLGEIYEGGVGVKLDYPTALDWYQQAAQKEHAQAQARLAYMFSKGLGTAKDDAKAFQWYLRAANNGDVPAQFKVGLLYRQGRGTQKNNLEAYKWLTISASYGDPDAPGERNQLEGKLSASDRQRALDLASSWERQWEDRSRGKLD
jgi:TPR repeat protein